MEENNEVAENNEEEIEFLSLALSSLGELRDFTIFFKLNNFNFFRS